MSWVCPHCGVAAILEDDQFSSADIRVKSGAKAYRYTIKGVTCPNPHCYKAIIFLKTEEIANFHGQLATISGSARTIPIIPSSKKERAKDYPAYIPDAVLNDYKEACAIIDLSPKASATLARRCLQGMIRDFWEVKADTLYKEIQAIEDKVDPLIWDGIESIRKVGNIGAHMEKDINLIVDVNPEEADLLIEMIEMLLEGWYVARYNREQKLQRIKQIAADKAEAKKG
ncbi:DUF4145 domain-containing protein [Cronobacter sakazakii]